MDILIMVISIVTIVYSVKLIKLQNIKLKTSKQDYQISKNELKHLENLYDYEIETIGNSLRLRAIKNYFLTKLNII